MFFQRWILVYGLLFLWTCEASLGSILPRVRRTVTSCRVEMNKGQKYANILDLRTNAGVCQETSSICDTVGILNMTEEYQLNDMIRSLRREVPCLPYLSCRSKWDGICISITLVSRVLIPEGSSVATELYRCAEKLEIDGKNSDICENRLLIVYSQCDMQMSIYAKPMAVSWANSFCINKLLRESQTYFKADDYFGGLLYVITSLKNEFLGFGCRPNNSKNFEEKTHLYRTNEESHYEENVTFNRTQFQNVSFICSKNRLFTDTAKYVDKPESSAQKHTIHTAHDSGHTTIYSGAGGPVKDKETTAQIAWWVIVLIVLGLCILVTVVITGLLCCCGCEKYMASGGPDLSARQRAWTV
ncbi:uncharacterized protein LOC106156651 [Lingula anatina]|uniref:Uncharacterized protein LOC106156651 n=1 Tax=Lingula anatina TaxID=7574 RepID=A0A1S3HPH7_LINAN|nr:uncharacterized protein LOC106156651 [Lingula anatina]|eukprot:XP_013387446.1 uncharacterized protein LOC106156651 [Lingula anatina]